MHATARRLIDLPRQYSSRKLILTKEMKKLPIRASPPARESPHVFFPNRPPTEPPRQVAEPPPVDASFQLQPPSHIRFVWPTRISTHTVGNNTYIGGNFTHIPDIYLLSIMITDTELNTATTFFGMLAIGLTVLYATIERNTKADN